MMNDSYLFLTAWYRSISFLWRVLLSITLTFGGDFPGRQAKVKNKTMHMTAQMQQREIQSRTHARLWTSCHTQLCLFSSGHMEMSAPPMRCLLMSGHVAGMDLGHTYALSSCVGDCWPVLYPPACVPPLCLHPPRRETNCECYWLPQQIFAVQWVNKMDGVVRLSSGKVFWQHASGRVQHSPG